MIMQDKILLNFDPFYTFIPFSRTSKVLETLLVLERKKTPLTNYYRFRWNVYIGKTPVFTHDGDVAININRQCISCKNCDSMRNKTK